MLASPDFCGTITELCEEVGVPRRTLYNWLGDEAFCAEVNRLIDRYTDSELSRVWKSLMRLIDKGDLQAIKLYFELKGKYKAGVGTNHTSEEHTLDRILEAVKDVE
jgi:AcrR family transcriptional regulator